MVTYDNDDDDGDLSFNFTFYFKIVLILIIINVFLTVVWNPWAQKAMTMSDFGDDEVCFFPESSKVQ